MGSATYFQVKQDFHLNIISYLKMIGIDIVSTKKFKTIKERDFAFWKKIFTKNEWIYCFRDSRPNQHLAGIFAAKEAVMKAVGGKLLGRFDKIRIEHNKSGKPCVRIGNHSSAQAQVSIATEKEFAIAIAISMSSVIIK